MEDGYFNSWVAKIKINAEAMTIEFSSMMDEAVYVHGTKVDSVCQFAVGNLLLAIQSKNVILIVKNWVVIHETQLEGKFAVSESLLFPNFNIESFPIVFELGKKSYNVVNVMTGIRNVLIRASAKCDHRQHPVVISAPDIGRISIDFPVAQLNETEG